MRTRSGVDHEVFEELVLVRPALKMKSRRASKVLSSKNSKVVEMEVDAVPDVEKDAVLKEAAGYSFSISYSANKMNPHWCIQVSGVALLPFLSCIETMKLFSECYPEIRQIRREGGRFILETSIDASDNLRPPENLKTRLQQFCINASHVPKVEFAPKVSQILWTR